MPSYMPIGTMTSQLTQMTAGSGTGSSGSGTGSNGQPLHRWHPDVIREVQNPTLGGVMPAGASAGQRRAWLENTQAAITRSQWQNFLQNYRPVEEDLIARAMQTDFSAEGDEAGQTARVAAATGRGMLARNMSRLGTRMTAEQADAVRRRSQLGESKAVAGAENATRRTLYDSRGNLLAGLVNVGRQAASGVQAGYGAMANNAASTEMMLNQGAAAANSTNMSMAMSLASLMIMAA